ncbi:heme oxygenase-like protein [Backusella circina FSU 941]|nr:heme oxygenase-like protein [Backusella circina FSU 941]
MKLTNHLLSLDENKYKNATQHHFLNQVGSLEIAPAHLKSWLIQDRFYTAGYVKMMGAMINKLSLFEEQREMGDNDPSFSPERSQHVLKTLTFALSNIYREFNFFGELLSRTPYATSEQSLDMKPWTQRYLDFQLKSVREGGYDLGESLVVLWAMEQIFFDAWNHAKSQFVQLDNNKKVKGDIHFETIQELLENWTMDEFKAFVDECGALVDALSVQDPKRLASFERAYRETLDIEVKFWDMAFN